MESLLENCNSVSIINGLKLEPKVKFNALSLSKDCCLISFILLFTCFIGVAKILTDLCNYFP